MSFLGGIRRASITLQQCRAYSSKKPKIIIKNQGKQIRNMKMYNPHNTYYQDKIGKAYALSLNKRNKTNYTYKKINQYIKEQPLYLTENLCEDKYLTQKANEHAFKN